ncbi:hypothetical protein [Rhizobium sp. NZLR10]|jgi:hypothetical protein|nr:hypothetical protein [Rhizobium sp. NZLR10]
MLLLNTLFYYVDMTEVCMARCDGRRNRLDGVATAADFTGERLQ